MKLAICLLAGLNLLFAAAGPTLAATGGVLHAETGKPDSPPAAKVETAPKTEEKPKAEEKPQEAKLAFAEWHSLYYAGDKIGYRATSLYLLADGAQRLETNIFLRRARNDDRFGYYKMIKADVDARGRPLALDCRVKSGERAWQVTGKAQNGELVLARTAGSSETTAKIPIEADLAFLSWTLVATMRGGAKDGEVRHWTVIDESLGGVLHDPCLVRVIGQRTFLASAGATLTGRAVLWACGPEQVAFLSDSDGRNLRGMWQSSPMVAVAGGLTEARRLAGAEAVPGAGGVAIEGLQGRQYACARLGYGFSVPPLPYVIDVSKENGVARLRDLTDEAMLTVYPAAMKTPLRADAVSDADWNRLSGLLFQQWAVRYEDVKAEAPKAERVAERDARAIHGTARLGCTTLHFRNLVFIGDGIAYLVSVTSEGPMSSEEVLALQVPQSLRFAPPEGQLAIQGRGDRFESAKHGFEIHRPGPKWKVPTERDGPATALELVRDDLSAVAVVRVLSPRPGQSFKDFVADQADLASDNLTVNKPEIRPAKLDGREGLEVVYEGKLLSEQPARCTGVYVPLGGRIFCLMLMARKDADAAVEKEFAAVRQSVKFAKPVASK
jgi:hypothetical protein